ncbi:hypothetical protein J1N10_13005 [Carboxylicivirga sp. A043]|uniref:LamG-like jellyroll fold domain-containing protein n=1 Tax=Carboxylicivirga litoralis TaxID=2816963 RepID=UPI0021CAE9C3|nr:LamG-like jellyroll fold domain-containing protein [Carboxylicivirga sp. A043]MCU4156900.1 hypothetical protein [Carboxylicivirga sp. A043]
MKRLNTYLLIFTLLSSSFVLTAGNKASHTSLYTIDFKKTTLTDLTTNGWTFFSISLPEGQEPESLPAITNQGLRLSPYESTSPLFTPNQGNPISEAYSEITISIRYRLSKKNIGYDDYLKIYLDNTIPQSALSKTKILHDEKAQNGWKTFVYTLTEAQLNSTAISLQFYTGSFLPNIEIKSIEISGLPADETPILSAAFTAESQYLATGDTLRLIDLSDGYPTTWHWTINNVTTGSDPIYSSSSQPTIPLTEDGFYDVTLEIEDATTSSFSSQGHYITVGCPSYAENITDGYIAGVTLMQGETEIFSQTSGAETSAFYNLSSSAVITPEEELTLAIELAELSNDEGGLFADSVLVRVWFGYYSNTSEFTDNYLDIPIEVVGTSGSGTITFNTLATSAPGKFIMRLKLSNTTGDLDNACSKVANGEVETYALTAEHSAITNYLGNSLVFNGGYLQVGDGVSAENGIYKSPQSEFTIGGWVKRTSLGDFSLFSQGSGDNDADKSFELRMVDQQIEVLIDGNIIINTAARDTKHKQAWSHVSVVGTGSEIQLFIANRLISSASLEGPYFINSATDTYTRIGDSAFRGELEGTRFWSVARTAEQLKEGIYNTIDTNSEGLLVYYQYNYGTLTGQSLIHDWHGHQHATIHGDLGVTKSFAPFLFKPGETVLKSTTSNETVADIFDPANWSWHPAELPNKDSKVVINNDTRMVINTDGQPLTVSSLEVSRGSKVYIAEGSSLDVRDSIIFRTTYEKPSSFLGFDKLSNIDVDVYVEYLLTTDRNWYLGVIGDNVKFADLNGTMYTDDTETQWDYYVYSWLPATGWVLLTDDQQTIEPLKGYLFHTAVDEPHLFYNGRVSYEQSQSTVLSERGYHLVSNPFWSYLSLSEMVNEEHAGSANFTNGTFNQSFTLWTTIDNARVYAHYDAANGIASPENSLDEKGLLAPGQAFFLYNNGTNATFEIDRRMLAEPEGTNPSLKSTTKTSNQVLRIRVSNEHSTYDAAVALRNNGSFTKTKQDTELRKAKGKTPMVYTIKNDDDNVRYDLAINILPDDFERLVIPIGIDIYADGVGTQTLELSGLEALENITATIVTPDGQTYTAKEAHSIEIYMPEAGTIEGYQLVLERVTTSINAPESEDCPYIVNSSNGRIFITAKDYREPYTINITTVNGTTLLKQTINTNQYVFTAPSSGLYIVSINSHNTQYSVKTIVTKN